jgi:hypothetical protein
MSEPQAHPIADERAEPPPLPAPTKPAAPAVKGELVIPGKTAVQRQTLEGNELEVRGESESVAVRAKALVAARYLVAERRPRNPDDARARLLAECRRPGFAQVAEYAKPQGDSVVRGPSIRFAEAALRIWGNVLIEVTQVLDTPESRTIQETICDLETNFTVTKDQLFEKTVERKHPRRGQEIVGERVNTKGETVFLVRANEDESLTKENAFASKVMRTQGLRIIPGDVIAEALAVARETRKTADAQDPEAGRKRIADAFAELKILPSELRDFLGNDLAQATPHQLEELRAIWVGINEGQVTWKEVLAEKAQDAAEAAQAEKPAATESKVERLKRELAEKKAKKGAAHA